MKTLILTKNFDSNAAEPTVMTLMPQSVLLTEYLLLLDWVAPVAGNVYRARCRWCQVELRAHYKDLKHHAESTKHTTSAMMHEVVFETKDSADESSLTDEESVQQGDTTFHSRKVQSFLM